MAFMGGTTRIYQCRCNNDNYSEDFKYNLLLKIRNKAMFSA